MASFESIEKLSLIAKETTADIYHWGPSQILKLFLERIPGIANEVAASRMAHKASLPVPEVIDGLIGVSQREGIVFERVDGPTMTEYLRELPEKAGRCARQAAGLQARIHSAVTGSVRPITRLNVKIDFHIIASLEKLIPKNMDGLFGLYV
jgi:hypothetical protein